MKVELVQRFYSRRPKGRQIKAAHGQDPFDWILIAKGIGIILVVVGHFHPETSPAYWSELRRVIYLFHMPLFFILSGYLYRHGKYSYRDLLKMKAQRLLYPFASIAAVFFLIKYVAGRFVNLEHPVDIHSIYALLADPVNSYVPLLWFVYALFLMFAIYPLARLFLGNWSILLLLLLANVVFGSDYLVFGDALANMPFFVVGVILRENVKLTRMTMSGDWRYVLIPLAVFCLVYLLPVQANVVYGYPTQLFLGVVGSLLVINISNAIAAFRDKKLTAILLQIGYYSMSIYLFHTLFESSVRIGFLDVFDLKELPFEVIAIVAVTCGVVFPLVLEKEVLRKYWVTRKFALGLA